MENQHHHHHKHTQKQQIQSGQSWIGWLFKNRIVLVIVMILIIIIVVPWLICDVLGLDIICKIISGTLSTVKKIFSFLF